MFFNLVLNKSFLYQNLLTTNLEVFKRWRQFTNTSALTQLNFGPSHELGSRQFFLLVVCWILTDILVSIVPVLINPVIANKGIVGAKKIVRTQRLLEI
ncbi:hypothetical protein [Leuconostoc suionicum]|uniref:hypothetical protein n=1 Tax=Leuconostoc suionicum TaxID=1511761 RepID=UPI0032DFFC62